MDLTGQWNNGVKRTASLYFYGEFMGAAASKPSFVAPGIAQLTFSQNDYAVIHNFTGGIDGAAPLAGLTIDGGGNLYGTAFAGGAGYGTLYKLTHKGFGWIFNPLYSFAGGNDGSGPASAVVIGTDGSLYGTTDTGGSGQCYDAGSGCGVVFQLKPPPIACRTALCSWTETLLHTFTGGSEGAYPFGNLISDHAGNLYGTTGYGGIYGDCDNYDGFGCGTAFMLTPANDGWNETLLWNFGQGSDGMSPYTGVIFDKSGNLYGTTVRGGQYDQGTVFQLTPSESGWTEKILYSFQSANDGSGPYAGLIMDSSGNLYGATPTGGQGGGGTVFELMPSQGDWTFTVLYSFPGVQGTNTGPYGSLVMDQAGNLYGTTVGNFGQGGDYGTVFKLTPSNGGWTYSLVHAFAGGSDGQSPNGALVLDSSGNLYGTAANNGAYGYGVVFQIAP
jgi:uncharacterized repeat protein (TIGR03803 family)